MIHLEGFLRDHGLFPNSWRTPGRRRPGLQATTWPCAADFSIQENRMSNSIEPPHRKAEGSAATTFWGHARNFLYLMEAGGRSRGDHFWPPGNGRSRKRKPTVFDLDLLYGGAGNSQPLSGSPETLTGSEEEARHAREKINNTYGDECVVPWRLVVAPARQPSLNLQATFASFITDFVVAYGPAMSGVI